MRHTFQPSPPLDAQAQSPISAASQVAQHEGPASINEESMGSPQAGPGLSKQRTFSMASFGSLDIRGTGSQAGLNDDSDVPASSVRCHASILPFLPTWNMALHHSELVLGVYLIMCR